MKKEEHVVVLIVTVAKFTRPRNPRRCNLHRYHVFRWRGGAVAPSGTRCECGALEDPPPAHGGNHAE